MSSAYIGAEEEKEMKPIKMCEVLIGELDRATRPGLTIGPCGFFLMRILIYSQAMLTIVLRTTYRQSPVAT